MKEKKVYTILVTYNAMPWIERCIGSLQASSMPTKVIVVDNHSADATMDFIRSHYPDIILLPQERNLGFGQANNIGIRYALEHDATHVLLLNQDAWIEEKMIETLLQYDDNNSLLSPIHLNGEGDAIDANFKRNSIERSYEYERFKTEQEKGTNGKYSTYEINAACWLLPRKILEETGGFNPLFFHYAEDTDYLQRLHYHGKGVYFVSGTYCYHDRAHAPKKLPTRQSIYQQLVLRAVDINYSPAACWGHRIRYGVAVWHTALVALRPNDIRLYYQALAEFYGKQKEIRQNREILKSKGAHWLS